MTDAKTPSNDTAESPARTIAASEYFNRNIGGKWERIEVTAEEMHKIKTETNKLNLNTLLTLKEKISPKYKLTETETLALFDKLSQHYRYAAESYVDQQLALGNVKK